MRSGPGDKSTHTAHLNELGMADAIRARLFVRSHRTSSYTVSVHLERPRPHAIQMPQGAGVSTARMNWHTPAAALGGA